MDRLIQSPLRIQKAYAYETLGISSEILSVKIIESNGELNMSFLRRYGACAFTGRWRAIALFQTNNVGGQEG